MMYFLFLFGLVKEFLGNALVVIWPKIYDFAIFKNLRVVDMKFFCNSQIIGMEGEFGRRCNSLVSAQSVSQFNISFQISTKEMLKKGTMHVKVMCILVIKK